MRHWNKTKGFREYNTTLAFLNKPEPAQPSEVVEDQVWEKADPYQRHHTRTVLKKVYSALVANKLRRKDNFAKTRTAINFHESSLTKKSYNILNDYRLLHKDLRLKYFEAIIYSDMQLQKKAISGLKQSVRQNEELEVAYGEALLINEKRLMLKVFKAARAINKIKRDDKYKMFNAIAHSEVRTLTNCFNALKSEVQETKNKVQKERSKMLGINSHMRKVKLKIYFSKLWEHKEECLEYRQKYLMAMQHYNDKLREKALAQFINTLGEWSMIPVLSSLTITPYFRWQTSTGSSYWGPVYWSSEIPCTEVEGSRLYCFYGKFYWETWTENFGGRGS